MTPTVGRTFNGLRKLEIWETIVLRRWLVSEKVAPTLTLSAFCDTEFGSVLQRRVPDCRIAELPSSQFDATFRPHS